MVGTRGDVPTEPALLTSRPDDVRPLMLEGLPWSPLDFIKGISPEGDRAVQFDSLLRDIDADDDLRIAYTLAPDTDVAVCAERLPWDSRFFGYSVARLHGVFPMKKGGFLFHADYRPALQALIDLARARGVRYLFGAIDSRDLPTIRALTELGFALIETRIYMHRSLGTYEYRRRFSCRVATKDDLDSLVALAREAENPYDRFHGDPFIGRDDARRLMETWIRESVLHGYADATIVPDSPNPGAMCTLKYHRDKSAAWGTSIGQLVLAMAAPGPQNRLVGTISELCYHLKGLGFEHAFLTTQINNRSAIRVVEHLGYRQGGRGEHVFRLVV